MTNDELIENNMKLAYMLANRYYKKFGGTIELDDLCSISLLALTKAARSYDETKGVAFSTFAYVCIKNEIIFYYRSNKKHKSVSLSTETAEDSILEDIIVNGNSSDEAIQQLEIDLLYKYINRLPEREKQVILLQLQGMTTKQIGAIFNCSQSRVSQLYYKALYKLRDMFTNYGKEGL